MDRTPLRKPYGRGSGILAHRSGLTTSLAPADATESGPVVDQQPDLIPRPFIIPEISRGSPEPISSERAYRGPAPDWLQEMDDADNCSSYSEGDFAEDFSDEEPNETRVQPPLEATSVYSPQSMPPSPSLSTQPTTPTDDQVVVDARPPTPPPRPPMQRPTTPPLQPTTPPRPQTLAQPFVFSLPLLPPATQRPPPSNDFWQVSTAYSLTPDNTLRGQREVIRQLVDEIREARGELATLTEQIAVAIQQRQDISRQRTAILKTVVAYDDLRKRRRLTTIRLKKERVSEIAFRDAVVELYSALRRDDD